MRKCRECGKTLPLVEFPIAIASTGTRRTRCYTCYRLYTRRFAGGDYQRHKQRRLATAQRYRRDHADAVQKRNRQIAHQRALDPEWQRHIRPSQQAQKVVRRAIKTGQLLRPTMCEQCTKPCKPDAAHDDYTQPLHVRWLCRSCHIQWDRAQPKLPLAHVQKSISLNLDA